MSSVALLVGNSGSNNYLGMGRQVERSERGLRSGLPRPRVEREEQVREISELKKALNRTRQELARSREVNRTSSDEEGCGSTNYTRASTATSRENVLRDSSRENMIRDSSRENMIRDGSRENIISRDTISRTGSLTGINSGMGSRSGSMNGLASKPSLNRELVSKLRSMTETIKMLSTENVALRQENDNLISNRNKDGDETMEDQNIDEVVHSYHNQLKAMEEKISELEGQLQKAEAGKDKDKTVDKAEKDKYKSLARRLKEERNNYKEMVEEKRKEQDNLKEEIEKMSDLIGELRQHCSQLQDELETQQVDSRLRRDMSIQTSPQLQRANLSEVSRRTFCRPRRSGSTVSPASTRNNSTPSLSRSNSQSMSRQQRGTDGSAKGKYSRNMSSPNSSPAKTAANSPLKNGSNSPGGSVGSQQRRGSCGSSSISSPAKAKPSPSKSLASPSQGVVGSAGAKIVKPVARQATVIKSGNRRKSESNSVSSPRTSECSPRTTETDDQPSHKQSTDNLVSKLPTYKASSSPSKIPTPSKSKLAKMSPNSQKYSSQANSNSNTGSARSSMERDSDERMSNSNSDEDRSYEKMDVCPEPPTLPASEVYLENGQDQKLYLEVSKDQQDGIELHISETDDAEEEFPAPPPPEDLAKLSFEAQFKIVSETVERACEKYKQAELNLPKETLIEPDTPRTTRKVDNFRQKLAARRIQRTWKHFYQELEEKRAEEGDTSYSSLPPISFPEETTMGLEPTTTDFTRVEQEAKTNGDTKFNDKVCKHDENIPDAKDTDLANVQAAILGHELRSRGLTFLREGSYATTRNRGGIFTARPWVITSESESDEEEDIKSIQGVVRSHSFRLGTINEGDVFRPGRVGSIRAKFSRQPPDGASAEIVNTIR